MIEQTFAVYVNNTIARRPGVRRSRFEGESTDDEMGAGSFFTRLCHGTGSGAFPGFATVSFYVVHGGANKMTEIPMGNDREATRILAQLVTEARKVASCVDDATSLTVTYPTADVHIVTAGDPNSPESLATGLIPLMQAVAAFMAAGVERTPGGHKAVQMVKAGQGVIEVCVDLVFELATVTFVGQSGKVLLFGVEEPMEAN
jgi:hypothetical protein